MPTYRVVWGAIRGFRGSSRSFGSLQAARDFAKSVNGTVTQKNRKRKKR